MLSSLDPMLTLRSLLPALGTLLLLTTACSDRTQPVGTRAMGTASVHPLIFDGGASPASHDYVIVIVNAVETNGLECNAILVAPNLVMTARHCVANLAGTSSCRASGPQPIHFHSDFPPEHLTFTRDAYLQKKFVGVHGTQIVAPEGNTLCAEDIAFVVLNKPITDVTPAVVGKTAPSVGDLLTVIGTGEVDAQGDFPDTRQERAGVAVTSLGPVELMDGGADTVVSAGELATTPVFCHGDSGGAAISSGGEVVAIVSRTSDCANGPDVFTTVAAHADLFAKALAAANPSSADAGDAPDASDVVAAPTSTTSGGCALTAARGEDGLGAGTWLLAAVAVLSLRRRGRAKP